MKDLVLFGMQGSGKGTQGKLLAERFGFSIFETGAELRKLMSEDSPLAAKVRPIVERGDLVPNEIVMEIIAHFIAGVDQNTAVLFDGIPRSMRQKETFDALLVAQKREMFGIFIDVPEHEAVVRLMARGRSDDNEMAIRKRIENYQKETVPVIETYEKRGLLRRVNGLQPVEKVFLEMVETLEEENNLLLTA
jgi:adenylate kinase